MISDEILVEGKGYFVGIFDNALATALEACLNLSKKVLYMPEIADLKIAGPLHSPLWPLRLFSPSIKVTGRTQSSNISKNGGTPVVIYAHVSNYFSSPKNIRQAIKNGLINGAAITPSEEFQRLLSLQDDKGIFVVDYDSRISINPISNVISVTEARKDIQTAPFFGGKERSEKYLDAYEQIYPTIGIAHCNDLTDQPLARPLCIESYNYGLSTDKSFGLPGRYLGFSHEDILEKQDDKEDVKSPVDGTENNNQELKESQKDDAPKVMHSSINLSDLEQRLVILSKPFIPDLLRLRYERKLRALLSLYKKEEN